MFYGYTPLLQNTLFNVEILVHKAVRKSKSTKNWSIEALSVIFRFIDWDTPILSILIPFHRQLIDPLSRAKF